MRNARWRWLPVLAWAALLLALGRTPGEKLPSSGFWSIRGADKVAHFGAYGVLGLLVAWALPRRRWRAAMVAGALAAAAVGGLDEWGQARTRGRTPDLADLAADVLGAAAGASFQAWVRRPRRVRMGGSS